MQIAQRTLGIGGQQLAAAGDDTLYMVGGPQLYAIGRSSGAIGPIGAEHLVGEMGGIWAHPCKVADGLLIDLLDADGAQLPTAGAAFHSELPRVGWEWRAGPLRVARRDYVPEAAPAYAVALRLEHSGDRPLAGALRVRLPLAFLGAWFGGIACDGGAYRREGDLLLGQDGLQTGWGIAFGAATPPASCTISPRPRGALATLSYPFRLGPGAATEWLLLLAVSHSGGAAAAAASWRALIARGAAPPAANAGLPQLTGPDDLTRDAALAQANLSLLQASYPDTGAYFLAGLPEYPQLFGCDSTYSVPGATAAGFAGTARAALAGLASYAGRACGRVPHEITTNGRVFHPGNIQETPQFTIAVWDYLRWSGDLAFARELFPLCREGLIELLATASGPASRYPYGDGMVERLGMGSRKLDSACYAIAGLRALAAIAAAIGAPDAAAYQAQAEQARQHFERDWWLEDEGLYADSMRSDGGLQLDGHWTAVLPVQLGLASPARAGRVLGRIAAEFVNEWGLVHTRAREETVWTLPTGLLALAAFAHGQPELGLRLTGNIALTARHGALGTFKELIPQGLCFVQLWSAALYLQAIYEGLLGLRPLAHAHRLDIAPCLPATMPTLRLRGLRVGAHLLDLTVGQQALQIHHQSGSQPLAIHYAGAEHLLAPGAQLDL